jgi:hypothetical protein
MLAAASSAPAWIALGIACATLAWTMFWSVWQHRRLTRVHLRVRTAIGFPTFGVNAGTPHVTVSAANDGPVAVTINSVLFRVHGRSESFLVGAWEYQEPPLPARLEPGAGHWQGMVAVGRLRPQLNDAFGEQSEWRVHAWIGTTAGRTFRSRRLFSRRWPWIRRWIWLPKLS